MVEIGIKAQNLFTSAETQLLQNVENAGDGTNSENWVEEVEEIVAGKATEKSFTDLLQQKFENFEITEKDCNGYVDGEDKFQDFLKFVNASGYYFYRRTSRTYSDSTRRRDAATYHFQLKTRDTLIPFFGSIFQPEGVYYYSCIHGQDHMKRDKEVAVDALQHLAEATGEKQGRRSKASKRIGCKAKMVVKRVRVFPEYTITAEEYERNKLKLKVVKEFKEDLKTKDLLSFPRFYIWLSKPEEHSHPTSIAEQGARLHPKLVSEIHSLVEKNVRSADVIRYHLELVVENMFANSETKPELTNTCFYPATDTIYRHIYGFLGRKNRNKIDQTAVRMAIKKWKSTSPDDFVLFRPYSNPVKDEGRCTFLFCHQTIWQQQVLSRYGDHICFLDSISTPAIQLYFITVKTNVDYCVVGSFALESKSKDSIVEALTIFSTWNPQWEPRYFMTQRSSSEITAVESVFQGCRVHIGAFHREKAWREWLEKIGIPESTSEELRYLWQCIALSSSEEEFQANLDRLYDDSSWKSNKKVHDHFRNRWLRIAWRWIDAFCHPDYLFYVKMNNGIDAQNHLLTHSFLHDHLDKSVSEVLTVIVEQFVPESLRQYATLNGRLGSEFRVDYATVPPFLANRPYHFIKHMLERISVAESFMGKVSHVSDGVFCVESEVGNEDPCIVTFDPVKCTCRDFAIWMYPCQHFCVVFLFVSGWPFEQLPESYRESVFLMVDVETEAFATENNVAKDNEDGNEFDAVGLTPQCELTSGGVEEFTVSNEVVKKQIHVQEKLEKAIELTNLCMSVDMLTEFEDVLQQWNSKLISACKVNESVKGMGKRKLPAIHTGQKIAKTS